MFQSIVNFFKTKPAAKTGHQWCQWYESATAIQKKEQLESFDNKIYKWVIKAEQYVSPNQIDEIVDAAVFNYIYKLLIPQMTNLIKAYQADLANNDPDLILVEIEKQKLKELQEMSWRQALKK